MEKIANILFSKNTIKIILFVLILLLVLALGIFFFNRLNSNLSTYRIENKYYGFEIKTPAGWFVEGMTFYSEDNIAQILQVCQNDKTSQASGYEMGHFKFKSHQYPQNFNPNIYASSGFPSGIVLDIAINCIPSLIDKNTGNTYSDLNIKSENTLAGFSNYPGSQESNHASFLYNGLQYIISEQIYISSDDKKTKGDELVLGYNRIVDEIVSSFKLLAPKK